MIRLLLLYVIIFGLAVFAWRDWYKSLCGLVVLMAFIEHPDMPKSMLGVQGLNPWNLCLAVVLLAWATTRGREGAAWDMPRGTAFLLLAYLGVIVAGFARMMADRHGLEGYSSGSLISECLINNIKWVIPGILMFDGCRTQSRFRAGMFSLLAVYLLLALQVVKWMPLSTAMTGSGLSERSLKIIANEIGYSRVNLSAMLAGASWAIISARVLARGQGGGAFVIGAAMIVLIGQALTAGRMGYVAWFATGLFLCTLRWRRYLLLLPVAVVAAILIMPGAAERMSQGFSRGTRDFNARLERIADEREGPDAYTVTAGRNVAWPFVIEKIRESPVFGYGRLGMIRTGVAGFLQEEFGESFPHPHNAYLEMLLDNGIVGLLLVAPFYLVILKHGISLFRDPIHPEAVAVGGAACAIVLAFLIASIGSQTFYPREGAVPMWCAIGLLIRVRLQRSRLRVAAEAPGTAGLKLEFWEAAPAK